MRPVLSVGMIFKNEIRCLERCLNALRPLFEVLPCELVMADTGATDGSREVAERFADILIDFKWINDFSAARNAVMEKCSGKWYLSIDADETLDPNVDELVSFVTSESTRDYDGAYLLIHNFSDAADLTQYSSFHAPRLLNMDTGLRFVDAIHEHWPWKNFEKIVCLSHTALWHDGYLDIDGLTSKEKSERNMRLIQKMLVDDPDNLDHLEEAVESSDTPEDKIRYTRKVAAIIEKWKDCDPKPWPRIKESEVMRTCIQTARAYHMPEEEKWMDYAVQNFGESLYTKIDVMFYKICDCYEKENWRGVLENGAKYLEGVAEYDQGAENGYNLTSGIINEAAKPSREQISLITAMAHIQLREWDACKKIMEQCSFLRVSPGNLGLWFKNMFFSWEHIDWTAEMQQVGRILYRSNAVGAEIKDKQDQLNGCVTGIFSYDKEKQVGPDSTQFYPEKAALPLLMELGPCDLSRMAKIAMADLSTRDEINSAANEIEKWNIPVKGVLDKLYELDLELPDCFYRQPVIVLRAWAILLTEKYRKNPEELLSVISWAGRKSKEINEAAWKMEVITAALMNLNWKRFDASQLQTFCDLFAEQTELMLKNMYSAQTLQESNIGLLPGILTFGWYYLQSRHAEEQGDLLTAVKWLRKALEAAPEMKNMTQFLTQEAEKTARERAELMETAQRVKMLLSAYAPDDPAVLEIKRLPVYQKIAYLLE